MLIAICDDNKTCLDELETCVKEYFSTASCNLKEYEIHTFLSGEGLLKSFTPHKYDIVFLDIDMPDIDGMELAARIRQTDRKTHIIFVTYMEDQLPYGYRFKASGFVTKPYSSDRIAGVIDDVIAWVSSDNCHQLEVKLKGGGVTWIETRNIVYLESIRHYMVAVNKDGARFEFLGKISDLQAVLSDYDFVRLHRSYLVNLAYVFIMNTDSVRLNNGLELPLGRSYSGRFKKVYGKYRERSRL